MREIDSRLVQQTIRDLFLKAAHMPCADATRAVEAAYKREKHPLAAEALRQLAENARVAGQTGMPYCQDTGLAVVFIDIGQDVHISGSLPDAVNAGVREAYDMGYLRKSVLDPVTRQNTGDNTPAVIHFDITPGSHLIITAAPKGFGSENMSRLSMLKPSDGIAGIEDFVIDSVTAAGGSPCPPVILGVGIGGTFEQCALLAKKQLLRELGKKSADPDLAALEHRLLEKINALGIGAMGFGGSNYCLAVHAAKTPTHIAGLPVAVNFQCHASRHASASL